MGRMATRPQRLARLMLPVATVLLVWAAVPTTTAGQDTGDLDTPPDITISSTPTGPVFADAKGYTLYVTERDREPGASQCFGPCATEWPPLRAATNAEPFGDWALVARNDGAPQWAYKGRPLYRYRWEARTGWAEAQSGVWRIATTSPFPVRGARRRSRNVPKTRVAVSGAPGGVVGQVTPAGTVLVDWNGMSLYTLPGECADRCLDRWLPLTAPMAAMPTGDWAPIRRPDGAMQWTHKGQALFRCVEDVVPGEVGCESVDAGSGHAVRVPAEPRTAVAVQR